MPVCNSTLSESHWKVDPVAGNLSFHTLGWIICAACCLISSIISFWLMYKHATNYTNPKEQRQILRILFMIPIYSFTTTCSYVWYWHAVYWEFARDCYEAFAIASFFTLMCYYIAPELSAQKDYFATMAVKPWPWPITTINKCTNNKFRAPRNGLTWFNLIWFFVFQYCFVRVATTIISTTTQTAGVYCEDSISPAFAHFWMMFFNSLAVTVAMYALIAFYINLKKPLAPNKPLLKLLCIKLVIFFCFWQMIVTDFLSSANIIKPSRIISPGDIAIGFNALLVCFEMIIFSILHLFAFPWRVYVPNGVPLGVGRAILDALNPFDFVRAFGRGVKYVLIGYRRRHEDTAKVAERVKVKEDTLVTNAATPGGWPGRTYGQPMPVNAYNLVPAGDPGGMMVHHPSPSDQEPVPQEADIPTHGLVEREHVGYKPEELPNSPRTTEYFDRPATVSPVYPHPQPASLSYEPVSPELRATSSYQPASSSPAYPYEPVSPHLAATSPVRNAYSNPYQPVSQLRTSSPDHTNPYLPYPALSSMPTVHGGQSPYRAYVPGESQELLAARSNQVYGSPLPSSTVLPQPIRQEYTYSESMVDEEGIYRGPSPRRRMEEEQERWREV